MSFPSCNSYNLPAFSLSVSFHSSSKLTRDESSDLVSLAGIRRVDLARTKSSALSKLHSWQRSALRKRTSRDVVFERHPISRGSWLTWFFSSVGWYERFAVPSGNNAELLHELASKWESSIVRARSFGKTWIRGANVPIAGDSPSSTLRIFLLFTVNAWKNRLADEAYILSRKRRVEDSPWSVDLFRQYNRDLFISYSTERRVARWSLFLSQYINICVYILPRYRGKSSYCREESYRLRPSLWRLDLKSVLILRSS